MRKLALCLAWLVILSSSTLHAETQRTEMSSIPSSLEPWRGWVLKDQEYRACPLIAGKPANTSDDFICAWPGILTITASINGATLVQHWHIDANSWIPLPGNAEHWPQQVTVNGQTTPVINKEGPHLLLAPGSYDIRAHIPWQERPQSLHIPETIGLIALNVDGKTVTPVHREGNEVTLGRTQSASPEADNLELHVFRKLTDGVPAELTTQIKIDVSGQAREEIFGPVLPDAFAPLTLNGGWPARLDSDGRMRVQVRPGSTIFTLTARATATVSQLTVKMPAIPWPQQEIWSYEAAPSLRVTNASSLLSVDPRQSGVPNEWSPLPAFAISDGTVVTIEERSRGLATDEGNRLTLNRETWLDFSGHGWYTHDSINGQMRRDWRLDMAAPFKLEHAEITNTERLLITQGEKPNLTGVEWRTPQVNLSAGGRLEHDSGSLPVTGWQQTFDQVTTTLHLPYGYRLIAAPGADHAQGSWMNEWTLLDLFVAAMLVLFTGRLLGWTGAVVATGYLLLGYQEAGAPRGALAAVLALTLIARALPEGRMMHFTRSLNRISLALLILIVLPFVANQFRYALYPQLEPSEFSPISGMMQAGFSRQAQSPPRVLQMDKSQMRPEKQEGYDHPATEEALGEREDAMGLPPSPEPSRANSEVSRSSTTAKQPRDKYSSLVGHYAQSTVIQAGRGEPNWQYGSRYVLSWSGPVLPQQNVQLIIASSWLVRSLRIALVGLLAWLVWQLYRSSNAKLDTHASKKAAIASALIAASLSIGTIAQAQAYPSQELLEQLKQRLIEAPKCAPECANIAQAHVSARADEIHVALETHAAERVALPLPDGGEALVLHTVILDGAIQDAIMRQEDHLWINLPRGVHRLELNFKTTTDKVDLEFPLVPLRVVFDGKNWQASGLDDDRLLAETLSLIRLRDSTDTRIASAPQQFPPFVRVERQFTLGLDWSAHTVVYRLAPQSGGFTVEIPLVTGEFVSSRLKVKEGRVLMAMADGQAQAQWDSTLDKSDTFTLTAPSLSDHAEIWRIAVSPMWHITFNGVPESNSQNNGTNNDYHAFEFYPMPGETLTVRITRPEAVPGSTRAIEAVSLRSIAGQRAATHVLAFTVRASQGGEHALTLPATAEVLAVNRDNQPLNLRPREGKLSLPIVPGTQHFEVHWRENTSVALLTRMPALAMGLPAANIDLSLTLPDDRWILLVFGPTVGPAVLYWGELIVMALLAFALSCTRRTPLRFHHWLLLGLGFSTFSWGALLIVVIWLFALDWRAHREGPRTAWRFDIVQIGLVLLTFSAIACLVSAIPNGLLGQPDMHLTGNGSFGRVMQWFADQTTDMLPSASAISVPLWVYKVAMLVWALWLANAVIGWLRWGFTAWARDGYWQPLRQAKPAIVDTSLPPSPTTGNSHS